MIHHESILPLPAGAGCQATVPETCRLVRFCRLPAERAGIRRAWVCPGCVTSTAHAGTLARVATCLPRGFAPPGTGCPAPAGALTPGWRVARGKKGCRVGSSTRVTPAVPAVPAADPRGREVRPDRRHRLRHHVRRHEPVALPGRRRPADLQH